MLVKLDKMVVLVLGLTSLAFACSDGDDGEKPQEMPADFDLTSSAFSDGQPLPLEYTCSGKSFPFSGMPPVDHTLPALSWTAGPAGTQSYAIVFKDVTLTTGTPINELGYHWAIWNIPPSVLSLPRGLPSGNPVAAVPGAKQYSGALFNDGYIGPCPSWSVAPGSPLLGSTPPPAVSTDSYTFTVFAMPTAPITEPTMRPEPGADAPPMSYVRDLDEFFIANAIGSASLATTSDAQPAMFATPM